MKRARNNTVLFAIVPGEQKTQFISQSQSENSLLSYKLDLVILDDANTGSGK